MTITANDLLNLCVTEFPTKEITLKCGKKVKVRALDGLQRLEQLAAQTPLERTRTGLKYGLVEPELDDKQREAFIKGSFTASGEIFSAVCELNKELDDASAAAKEEAVKNSEGSLS